MVLYKYENVHVELDNTSNVLRVEIKTPRLYIRNFTDTQSDRDLIYQLLKCEESTKLFCEGGPASDARIEKWIGEWLGRINNNDPFCGLLVFPDSASSDLVGHALLTHGRVPGESEFGIILHKNHWGQGYGYEIVSALVNEYTDVLVKEGYKIQGEEYKSIYATARIENHSSNKIIEKVGLKKFDEKILYGAMRNCYIKHLNKEESKPI